MFVLLSELYRMKFVKTYDKLKKFIDHKKYICLRDICEKSFSLKNKKYSNFKLKDFHKIMTSCTNEIDYHQAKNDVKAVIEILREILITTNNNIRLNKLFETTTIDQVKIISFNVFTSIRDGKYGETFNQSKYLNESGADILCLQECSAFISERLSNYMCISVDSHCGKTTLGVNKIKLKNEPCLFLCTNGIILIKIKIKNVDLIIGSIHLQYGANGNEIRKEQINIINKWITDNKCEKFPVIICGDTNLRNKEYSMIDDTIFNFSTEETYPNKNNIYVSAQSFAKNFKVQYGYDKILYANCLDVLVKKIDTKDSDHCMLISNIKIKQTNNVEKKKKKIKNEKNYIKPSIHILINFRKKELKILDDAEIINYKLLDATQNKTYYCSLFEDYHDQCKDAKSITIKTALMRYYGDMYDDKVYEIYLQMKKYGIYSIFPILEENNIYLYGNSYAIDFEENLICEGYFNWIVDICKLKTVRLEQILIGSNKNKNDGAYDIINDSIDDFIFEIRDDFVSIDEALKQYYEDNYTESDYLFCLEMIKRNCFDIFPFDSQHIRAHNEDEYDDKIEFIGSSYNDMKNGHIRRWWFEKWVLRVEKQYRLKITEFLFDDTYPYKKLNMHKHDYNNECDDGYCSCNVSAFNEDGNLCGFTDCKSKLLCKVKYAFKYDKPNHNQITNLIKSQIKNK